MLLIIWGMSFILVEPIFIHQIGMILLFIIVLLRRLNGTMWEVLSTE